MLNIPLVLNRKTTSYTSDQKKAYFVNKYYLSQNKCSYNYLKDGTNQSDIVGGGKIGFEHV